MSFTRINQKGQIPIPKKFREILHCNEGDLVEIILDENTLRIIPKDLIDKNQTWFWTKEHQEEEAEAELELLQGKGTQTESTRDLIDELNKYKEKGTVSKMHYRQKKQVKYGKKSLVHWDRKMNSENVHSYHISPPP